MRDEYTEETTYLGNCLGEVVYTRSSRCILDIGLTVSPYSVTRIATRASRYCPDGYFSHYYCGEYGGIEHSQWIRTGIHMTLEEWSDKTYDRSTEEIAHLLGIM